MGEKSNIGWTDDTANPWIGCEKVSDGCKFCYAETFVEGRLKQDFKIRRPTKGALLDVLRWNKKPIICDCCGTALAIDERCHECGGTPGGYRRRRVFVGSMMDWLDEKAPMERFVELLDTIRVCQNLEFLCLTKRPENWNSRLVEAMALVDDAWLHGKEESRPVLGEWIGRWIEAQFPHRGMVAIPANVWFGVTVENQAMADKRIPLLLEIPAKVRWLSVEPMLGPIDFGKYFGGTISTPPPPFRSTPDIAWCVVGGESGPQARPFHVEWASDVVRQCKAAGVACFVKQLGSNPVEEAFAHTEDCDNEYCALAGGPEDCFGQVINQADYKSKKGDDPSEWPVDLRVQQWPEVVR